MWKCTPLDCPPKDGTWIFCCDDDGSGAPVIAWLTDEGWEGWHTMDAEAYIDGELPDGTVWVPVPGGLAIRAEKHFQEVRTDILPRYEAP